MAMPENNGFPVKTALAIATVALVLTLWHWRVQQSAGLDWRSFASVPRLPMFAHKLPAIAPVHAPEPDVQGSGTAHQDEQPADALLIDNAGALDRFYAALAKLDKHAPDASATVIHFGDSPTTADLITGDVRQQLQQRFGDAGQGFNLIAKPWAWYQHFNIDASDKGWKFTTAVGQMREGAYGIGGATFDGGSGATATFKLKGSEQNAVELAYDAKADGGTIDTGAAQATLDSLDTSKAAPGLHFERVALPAGTKSVELHVTSGSVRLYGILFERTAPGVLYDSIGLNGATTSVVARALNGNLMQQSFAHLAPALVVINFGTNESSFGSFVDKQYEGELRLAITRVRQAAPGADILIMSPMDRGERTGGNGIETMATIPRIVAIQQRVAGDTGCAFFNTFMAMGGEGTMQRWYDAKPRMVGGDLIHPSPAGARIVATDFVEQLEQGYARYQGRHKPLAPSPTSATPKP